MAVVDYSGSSSKFIDLYNRMRTEWVKARGRGATGKAGGELPRMLFADPIVLFALINAPVIRSLEHLTLVGPDDPIDGDGDHTITSWLTQCSPKPGGDPMVRYPITTAEKEAAAIKLEAQGFVGAAAAAVTRARDTEAVLPWWVAFQREGLPTFDDVAGDNALISSLVAGYQRCLDTAVSCADLASRRSPPECDQGEIRDMWSSLYQVILSLDVGADRWISETTLQQVVNASKSAALASSKAAGELAAGAANAVGNLAGQAGKGFLEGIGVEGLAVVAVGVALAMH